MLDRNLDCSRRTVLVQEKLPTTPAVSELMALRLGLDYLYLAALRWGRRTVELPGQVELCRREVVCRWVERKADRKEDREERKTDRAAERDITREMTASVVELTARFESFERVLAAQEARAERVSSVHEVQPDPEATRPRLKTNPGGHRPPIERPWDKQR